VIARERFATLTKTRNTKRIGGVLFTLEKAVRFVGRIKREHEARN
jgi:hypothetical protein